MTIERTEHLEGLETAIADQVTRESLNELIFRLERITDDLYEKANDHEDRLVAGGL